METIIDNLVQNIDNTAASVVQLLAKGCMRCATVESCTGGLVSAAITSVSGKEYDEILKGLLKPRLHSGECVIYFPRSKKPSKQLSATIKELAAKAGCKYTLSYEREDIEDGFVLVYGGIEENCSFASLFNERRSEITDYAAQLLLGTEE